MARYGKRAKYGKKRYGKKGYGKMRYRKMGRSKPKLYRQGGNFAMQSGKGPSPELKSYDFIHYNTPPPPQPAAANSLAAFIQGSGQWTATWTAVSNQFQPPVGGGAGMILQATSSTNCIPLNAVQNGPGLNQRIGRKITMRSIKFDAVFRAPCAAPTTATGTGLSSTPSVTLTNFFRLVLVYDRQTNGASPQYYDVLAPAGTSGISGATATAVESSNNLNNRSRFLTLFDKTYVVGNADIPQRRVSIYKKMNLPVIYTAVSSSNPNDVTTIQTGGLFLLCVGNTTQIVDPNATPTQPMSSPWAIMPSYRMRFTDL